MTVLLHKNIVAGAIAIFEKMGLNLVIGDYLGNFLCLTLTHTHMCVNLHIRIYIYLHSSLFLTTLVLTAIGAIFAATDSVCTLQVRFCNFMLLKSSLRNFFLD